MAYNLANTLGTATGIWSNGQLVGGQPGNVSLDQSTGAQTAAANAVANEYARQFDLQYKLSKQKLDNDYQVAARSAKTAEERNRIDQEYNRAQVQLAQQRLAQDQTQFIIGQSGLLPDGSPTLSLQQLQAQNAATEGQLTGIYKGSPTLANLGQTAQYTGLYNGTPTLQAQNQEQQYGLQQGALTGNYRGNPTLAAQGQAAQTAQGWANISGYGPNGAPTLANTQFQTGASGYLPNGQATLSREQAAASTSTQAAQVAASLQGPANWARFLQAQYGMANSPASSLVSSVPGGLGAATGANPPPLTLGTVLGGNGMLPVDANAQAGAAAYMGDNGMSYDAALATFRAAAPEAQAQAVARGQQLQQAGGGQQQVPAGGGGSSPWYTTGGGQSAAAGRSTDATAGADVMTGGRTSYAEGGGGQPSFLQGYAPSNLMGAIAGVANAPRVSNADLGFSDQEANTLKGYFNNPNSAPVGFWESKSQPERDYLGGVNSYWGGDQATFLNKYQNSRPRQQAWNMAV